MAYKRVRVKQTKSRDNRNFFRKHKERYQEALRQKRLFMMLDIIAVVGFLISLISFYRGLFRNGLYSLLIPIIVLGFYIARAYLRKRN